MNIKRTLKNDIRDALQGIPNKIVILYGPRQVGKTTLLDEITQELPYRTLKITADDYRYQEILSSRDLSKLMSLVSGYDCLYLDEAQRIPDIGINLKLLHDHHKSLRIVVSGSSSFDLANKIKEPLTGRTKTVYLFPIAIQELAAESTTIETKHQLESMLRYGLYPEVLTIDNIQKKEAHLRELSSSYLYKDILDLDIIRNSNKLHKLLQLLAFQIGSQVSIAELSRNIGLAQETVSHYIHLLEKSFVLFRLPGFSQNLRKEVTKMDKIYFYDIGIRNAVIENFNPISLRNDAGNLFENLLISERLKRNHYLHRYQKSYFWRLNTGAEIDYIEEGQGKLSGYEFKFNTKTAKCPASWTSAYPHASYQPINLDNYTEFLT